MNIQHASRTDRWLTPESILVRVREVLGEIDLDPASEPFANTRVKAMKYYTRENCGLDQPWHGSVYLNPPGGKRGNRSLSQLFWSKLMNERNAGRIKHAIFMAFSAESLSVTQGRETAPLGAFMVCVPAKRIRFDDWNGTQGAAPSHSNVIAYVPGTVDESDRFALAFAGLGSLMVPYR